MQWLMFMFTFVNVIMTVLLVGHFSHQVAFLIEFRTIVTYTTYDTPKTAKIMNGDITLEAR